MRYALLVFLACTGLAAAAVSTDGIDKLNNAAGTKVAWNFAKRKTADVDCDGKPDIILFGAGPEKIWVGVLPGDNGKPQVMSFARSGGAQNAFDAPPTRVTIYPQACDTDEMGPLEGCRQVKGCKSFSLDNDETDPFNFYWDARHKRFAWWRN